MHDLVGERPQAFLTGPCIEPTEIPSYYCKAPSRLKSSWTTSPPAHRPEHACKSSDHRADTDDRSCYSGSVRIKQKHNSQPGKVTLVPDVRPDHPPCGALTASALDGGSGCAPCEVKSSARSGCAAAGRAISMPSGPSQSTCAASCE